MWGSYLLLRTSAGGDVEIKLRPKCFIYQHRLANYNLVLFQKLKKLDSLDVMYFFDQDGDRLSSLLQADVPKSFGGKWLWRNRPIELYLSWSFIFRVIRERPNVILSEDGGNVLNNFILYVLKPILRYKLILWGLGEIPSRQISIYKRIAWPFIRLVWRHCDAILSYSTYGKDIYIRNGVEGSRIFVAHNAIDLGDVEARIASYKVASSLQKRVSGKKVILFIGRLEATKNVEDLLYAFKEIVSMEKNIILLIVGEGDYRKTLEELVAREDIKGCYFEGGRDLFGASEYLAFADVCVVPGEGGLVINHALVHGVPVVVSTGDGTEFDLIKDGLNGFFFDRGDIECLSKKILGALESSIMKSYTKSHVSDVPTVEKMVEIFVTAFNYALFHKNKKHAVAES